MRQWWVPSTPVPSFDELGSLQESINMVKQRRNNTFLGQTKEE